MTGSFEQRLAVLRAVAEETRLRIVTLLTHGELSVSELTEILGQSQPRVSRHLKVLTDAAVVSSHREGNYVFFANTEAGAEVARASLASIAPNDPVVEGDRVRLDQVRGARARFAEEYFARVAPEWDRVRSRHAPEADVEAAILAATSGLTYSSVLDLGTGTGRMLALLAGDRTLRRAVGLDSSPAMLAVARSNLDDVTFTHLVSGRLGSMELRQGDLHATPFTPGTFDLVVLHQVLHYLDQPQRALRLAAELVAPGGHLLVVDVAPHHLNELQSDHGHRTLGFAPDTVSTWMRESGLDDIDETQVTPTADESADALTVVVWRGAQPEPNNDAAAVDEVGDVDEVDEVHDGIDNVDDIEIPSPAGTPAVPNGPQGSA